MSLAHGYAVHDQTAPLVPFSFERRPAGPDDVRIEILFSGICHSDLSVINGDRPRPLPMAIGHEAAGVVVEVGPDVEDLIPGDHVVMVFMPSCGHCALCAEGRPALCEPGAAANGAGTLLGGVMVWPSSPRILRWIGMCSRAPWPRPGWYGALCPAACTLQRCRGAHGARCSNRRCWSH